MPTIINIQRGNPSTTINPGGNDTVTLFTAPTTVSGQTVRAHRYVVNGLQIECSGSGNSAWFMGQFYFTDGTNSNQLVIGSLGSNASSSYSAYAMPPGMALSGSTSPGNTTASNAIPGMPIFLNTSAGTATSVTFPYSLTQVFNSYGAYFPTTFYLGPGDTLSCRFWVSLSSQGTQSYTCRFQMTQISET